MQGFGPFCMVSFLAACIASPGHSATGSPSQDKPFGPGDRPSVCYERAIGSISPNLDQMTKIAEALLAEKAIDEVGWIRYPNGRSKFHMARARIPLVRAKSLRARFMALFDGLIVNFFTPWGFREFEAYVIGQPGLYDPEIFNFTSGPWCGGTDEAWRAESEKTLTLGVVIERGGPISYRYDPTGVKLQNPCSDEAFLRDKYGQCELRLDEHWAMVFFYVNKTLEQPAE